MRNQLVYDLPTRVFHWIFAGLFITAFTIAKLVSDESPTYSYHMLAGLTLSFVVILRLLWGFVGTKHAQFKSFALNPKDLISYLTGIISGDRRKWPGHNPASSWAALVMFALALGLGVTGYLMASGDKEAFEDIHELFANGFIVVAVLHVAGIVLHSLRHRDGIGFSMIDGSKQGIEPSEAISSSRSALGVLLMGLIAVFAISLVRNYDSTTQKLKFFGTSLQLGDNEKNEKGETKNDETEKDDDGDDD